MEQYDLSLLVPRSPFCSRFCACGDETQTSSSWKVRISMTWLTQQTREACAEKIRSSNVASSDLENNGLLRHRCAISSLHCTRKELCCSSNRALERLNQGARFCCSWIVLQTLVPPAFLFLVLFHNLLQRSLKEAVEMSQNQLIPRKLFGKTGKEVSIVGMGCSPFGHAYGVSTIWRHVSSLTVLSTHWVLIGGKGFDIMVSWTRDRIAGVPLLLCSHKSLTVLSWFNISWVLHKRIPHILLFWIKTFCVRVVGVNQMLILLVKVSRPRLSEESSCSSLSRCECNVSNVAAKWGCNLWLISAVIKRKVLM